MARLRTSDLVAVLLPPGDRWAGVLHRAWAHDAAVLPVDPRLPGPEVERLLRAARPTARWDEDGLHRLPDGEPAAPGVALVLATSGTTGAPRLVELTHAAVRAAVEASAARLGCAAADPWLLCLPVTHAGGMLVLVRALLLGAPLRVHPRFDPRAVARERDARFVALVPTMLSRLLEAEVDLARFRTVLVGGAALPAALAARARARGARLVASYGLTESCGGVVYDGVPLDGVGVRVGAGSEVLLRGPTVMRGYRRDPEATARALRDGWLRTGDAGALEGDGRLVVYGRLDDAIRTGGETVWPAEVEAALRALPGVADAAVVGRPHPEWGQVVVAVVVPADPAAPPTLATVRGRLGGSLAGYKLPRAMILARRLPRTPSGKVPRRWLRRLVQAAGR